MSHLRHVTDADPGIRRIPAGKGFKYVDPSGHRVRDAETLDRIRSIVIPPAWTDVWISPWPNGHIQAVGRDARKRKQYRYHPEWTAAQDEAKYHRMLEFGEALPRMRRRVARDLREPPLSRRRVLATVVRLMERTLIRVGNEEYARTNHSYGLTTLQPARADSRLKAEVQLPREERHSSAGRAGRSGAGAQRETPAGAARADAVPIRGQ